MRRNLRREEERQRIQEQRLQQPEGIIEVSAGSVSAHKKTTRNDHLLGGSRIRVLITEKERSFRTR